MNATINVPVQPDLPFGDDGEDWFPCIGDDGEY